MSSSTSQSPNVLKKANGSTKIGHISTTMERAINARGLVFGDFISMKLLQDKAATGATSATIAYMKSRDTQLYVVDADARFKILTTSEKDNSIYAGLEDSACHHLDNTGYWACLLFDTEIKLSWLREFDDSNVGATNAFKAAAQLANSVGGGITITGNGSRTYDIYEKIYFTESYITLDLQGAKVHWYGANTNLNNTRGNGVFNFLQSGDALIDETYAGVIEIGGEYEEREYTVSTNNIILDTAINSGFVAGDWIYIASQTSYSGSEKRARIQILTKIEKIERDDAKTIVFVTEEIPWGFVGNIRLVKYNPNMGSKVKNMNMRDYVSTDRTNSITGVVAMRTVDFTFEGINGYSFFNPVMVNYNFNNTTIVGGRCEKPKATDGGEGYYVQFGSGFGVNCKNLFMSEGRHLVDLTGVIKAYVENCHYTDGVETAFSLHGQFECDVTYVNCSGSVGVAISGSSFGHTAKNVTIINHSGRAFFNYTEAFNVRIKDSVFGIASTNCLGLNIENSRFEEYIKFNQTPQPTYDVPLVANVYGGYCKSQTVAGGFNRFIGQGVQVNFHGTEVIYVRNSNSNVNCDSFNMYGGIFEGGFNTPQNKGAWNFYGTVMRNTTFELNNNVYDGGQILLDGVSIENSVSTGLIRDSIPDTGIRNPVDNTQTVDGRYNIIIRGGRWEVDDNTHKTIDVTAKQCLNLSVTDLYLVNGVCVGDFRFPTVNAGNLKFDLMGKGADATIAVSNLEDYKHRDIVNDLNDEFGLFEEDKTITANPVFTTVFTLDHVSNATGTVFTTNNYPIEQQPKGLLIVEAAKGHDYVRQTIHYMFSGNSDSYNDVYTRCARFGTWSSWKQIV